MTTRMGIDPSIAGTGWAVLGFDCGKPYACGMGVIRTRPDGNAGKLLDRGRRVAEIGRELVRLLDAYDVSAVCVEGLVLGMKTSRATAQTLGRVRGLVEGICIARGLRLNEVDPQAVKRGVTGRRDASKEEMARMVRQIYGVQVDDLDATDALAVAHVGGAMVSQAVSGVVSYREPVEADDELDF